MNEQNLTTPEAQKTELPVKQVDTDAELSERELEQVSGGVRPPLVIKKVQAQYLLPDSHKKPSKFTAYH